MEDKKFNSVTEAMDDYHDRRRREIEAVIGTGVTSTSVYPAQTAEEMRRDRYRKAMRTSAANFRNDLSRFKADNPVSGSNLVGGLITKVDDFIEFLGNDY